MKNILLLLLALLLATGARAHDGEDHGGEAKASAGGVATSFSVAALSEKFELLLRFEPLEKGQDADLRLFISDYATNAPIKGAKLTVSCPEAASLKFAVSEKAPGIYLVEGTFPENKKYSLAVNVVAGDQADLMLLAGIEVGKKLPVAAVTEAAPSLFSSWKNVLLLVGAFVLGIALTAVLMRRRRPAPIANPTPAVYEKHA
ncbi:hypothetical protein [Hymenobacter arizonensis]|uniref:CopC domain-containing protein n=1 Tax=Hymenobacter arizonensis TaxID=1227077 RepID=A0A1I6AHK9_HYMAR|nr:hypothetical protein [Hymenobacter arizonensis]SFQ68037.1 hypothetical protein SAMN04515668_3678 [Hymenobacter arizonensis]